MRLVSLPGMASGSPSCVRYRAGAREGNRVSGWPGGQRGLQACLAVCRTCRPLAAWLWPHDPPGDPWLEPAPAPWQLCQAEVRAGGPLGGGRSVTGVDVPSPGTRGHTSFSPRVEQRESPHVTFVGPGVALCPALLAVTSQSL